MQGYPVDVERALLFRCPSLLHDWLPGGKQQGQYYTCANLTGGQGDSLKVYLSGPKAGKWADYAGDKGEAGGNLISLYAAIKGIEWNDALHQLADQVGVVRPKREKVKYQVIQPVPESVYRCGDDGTPLLPDIPAVKGAVAHWCYYDREGRLLCFRYRINKTSRNRDGKLDKDVLPLVWCRNPSTGEESWQVRDLPDALPLYNLPLLATGPDKILIVQGEKKAEAAMRLLPDWCATTQPGGDKKVEKTDWSPIRRLESARIVIWPDNDKSGMDAAAQVGELLGREYQAVQIDPAWPKSYDIADLEAEGWSGARVEEYLEKHVVTVQPEPPTVRPEVDLSGKDQYRQMADIFSAMAEIQAPVFNYNSGVVYVRRNIHGLLEVAGMEGRDFRAWAAKKLAGYHYNGNGKTPCPVNEDLANALIFNAPESLPALKRFADLPVFTPDGKLLETSGYHPESKVYVSIPPGYDQDMPIEQAWETIDDLLKDFPFETGPNGADKTCAVAFVLTAILRDLMAGPTPLFRFEAPSPGTGKSLLCRGLCEIVTPLPGACGISDSAEEIRKALTTSLLYNPAVVMFDNVEKIDSPDLMRAFSEYIWKERLLGQNRDFVAPIRTLWCATLNNPILTAEAFRRSVRIRLNAKVENPSDRPDTSFRHHPFVSWVRENRGALVSAFVAVAKNGVGETAASKPSFGSYESWVDALAPVMEMNSYPDFLKNIEEDRRQSLDSRAESLHEFIEAWAEKFQGREVSFPDLLELANTVDGLPIRRNKEGKIGRTAFGLFLKKHRQMVVGKFTIGEAFHTREGSACRLYGDFSGIKNSSQGSQYLPYSDPSQYF